MGLSEGEILTPVSTADAVQAFGDGRDVTVFAGGTILMPMIAYGRYPSRGRTLMLGRAGLNRISEDGRVEIGAMTTLAALADSGLEPLATAASDVADAEIRAQATLGGNLCAPPSPDGPRGDLQGALIALGARVRTVGPGGERTEAVEDFLDAADSRLVVEVELDEPRRAGHASVRRPHAHSYTILSVCAAETADGVRIGMTGAGPHGVRARSVEAAFDGGASPDEAAKSVLQDAKPQDDALASAWYRERMLPVLVRRALEDMNHA